MKRIFLAIIAFLISGAVYSQANIAINAYQFSSNQIAIQIKVANNNRNDILIPGYASQKCEVINNTLHITFSYDPRTLPGDPGSSGFSPGYVVRAGEILNYSIFLESKAIDGLKYSVIDGFSIYMGIIEKPNDTINSNKYSFSFGRSELRMVALECVLDKTQVLNYRNIEMGY
ncbi:hypothetical protein [Leadbettera azotonutricia]|uniref:Uncharacterized protein n=1 Tax=Leadbettera azotonutricia (strain ATCC BAA-888 / DSM 13862 / ZAS-9) TaxID=545695 RepID=F5Y9E2_LEAAZ|nr:hypothetical protein [Leadbettera azotonutricia]AEF80660.1 hypothetical protein TREAZ_2119 [Leadbettera azotonutricia ZAS-9]